MNSFKLIYRQQSYLPNFFGLLVNPFYLARRELALAISEFSVFLQGSLLDVGCGSKPYRSLLDVTEYVGLDIDSEASRRRGVADYYYDGNIFPFASSSFDVALCNQVLEHVFNPSHFLLEINRVIKPGGRILLTVPFVWDEHEQPFDYARYSSFGLQALLEKSGFKILQHKKLGADASVLFQLANAYLFKATFDWPIFFRLFFMGTVMATINILGLIAKKVLPKNPDLYLDNVVLAEKL